MHPIEPAANQTFVIVEPDPVVSMDLVGVVSTAFPRSSVNVNTLFTDEQAEIVAASSAVTILLSAALVTENTMNLLRSFIANGVHIVFIGEPVIIEPFTTVVSVPFTSRMILNALSMPHRGV